MAEKERALHEHEHEHEHEHGEHEWVVLLIGAVAFAAAAVLSRLCPSPVWLGPVLYLAAYLILGSEVLWEAIKGLFHGELFDENFLMALATIGAFAIREYPEAVGVMLFFRIGEFLEHLATERSRKAVMAAVDMRPETVIRLKGDARETIPAAEAAVNDVIEVRVGDRVPLDGTVLFGESRIDQSPVTGEPVPVAVAPGDFLLSGCINRGGVLTLRVDRALEDSFVSRILRSVESAAAGKPRMDRFITRFSRIYTPIVVIAAVLVALLPPLLLQEDWSKWLYTALTFLVISCPCALVLSVPLAFFSGIGAGSRQGILFKDGATLEALNTVKVAVMDKTGTLTEGVFAVRSCETAEGVSENRLLALTAGAESHSTHPIAVSIVAEAERRGLSPVTPLSVTETAGQGITATMPEGTLLCGNRQLMENNGVPLPKTEVAGTGVLVALNGQYLGQITVSDALKADAEAGIAALRQKGLRTVLLTGDSAAGAEAAAAALPIDEVHAGLMPEDKLAHLQALRQKHGAVLFVGDGINDAPVLAGADVGAAMGSGADAAIEAADVVYMTNAVSAVPLSRRIAGHAVSAARWNIGIALFVKAAVLIFGILGFANMWAAVFADTGVALLCILNSIRVLYRK